MSGVPLKMVHSWCSLPKDKIHKSKDLAEKRWKEFEEFLSQDTVSIWDYFIHFHEKIQASPHYAVW